MYRYVSRPRFRQIEQRALVIRRAIFGMLKKMQVACRHQTLAAEKTKRLDAPARAAHPTKKKRGKTNSHHDRLAATVATIAVVAAIAFAALVTVVALMAVAMIAVAAATGVAGTRCNAIFEAFHLENSGVHLIPPRCENRKDREHAPIKLPMQFGERNPPGTICAKG
jgi:hypothetical protein